MTRYAILLPGGELACVIGGGGEPATYAHRSSARRALGRSVPEWLAPFSIVVRVDVRGRDFVIARPR